MLDVRTPFEFSNGYIKNAINIPLDEPRDNMNKLDKTKEIILYCAVGLRGHTASRILSQNGFKTKNITGGYKSSINFTSVEITNDIKAEIAID